MLRISNSALNTFQQCPQKWAYRYIHRRVPLTLDQKLYFGKAIHRALELWWGEGPISALAWIEENRQDLEPEDYARARVILELYDPPAEDYRVIASEVPFSVTVKTPKGGYLHGVRLVGFIDSLLLENGTDRLIVREAKTTSENIEGFGPYWARLAVDPQIATYHLATNADGIVYDVLRRAAHWKISKADRKAAEVLKIRPLEAFRERLRSVVVDDPGAWYQWRPIWKTEEDRTAAQVDLYHQILALRDSIRRNYFPKHGGSCRGFFGVCPYLDVCTGRASLDDNGRFQDREEGGSGTR